MRLLKNELIGSLKRFPKLEELDLSETNLTCFITVNKFKVDNAIEDEDSLFGNNIKFIGL